MSKRIFIAATGRDIGKTSISLGLIRALREEGHKVGYIKPIGQRYITIEGKKVSEDVFLMKKTFDLEDKISDMSPFVVSRGYTRDFINGKIKSPRRKILNSFRRIEENSDIVIIEGTGHAGVGSVFGLSNAEVAKLLRAPVLIVSEGGIGSTIDKITLNRALFLYRECSVTGVIINKVIEKKIDEIKELLDLQLHKRNKISVFGYIPYRAFLHVPTLSLIRDALNLAVINDGDNNQPEWEKQIEKVIIATIEPHELMEEVNESDENILIVTSRNRSDILLAALTAHHNKTSNLMGVLITGGTPPDSIMKAINLSDLPVLVARRDVYSLASFINNLRVKITRKDKMKIDVLSNLFEEHVNFKKLYSELSEPSDLPLTWKDRFKRLRLKIVKFFLRIRDFLKSLAEESPDENNEKNEN